MNNVCKQMILKLIESSKRMDERKRQRYYNTVEDNARLILQLNKLRDEYLSKLDEVFELTVELYH